MKIKHVILFLILTFDIAPLYGQIQIDTIIVKYYNVFTEKEETICNYQLTNGTNDDYLTWVSLDPKSGKSNKDLVYDYFKKAKGDYSYINLMFEGILDTLPLCIGTTFVKQLKSGEKFSYLVTMRNAELEMYSERIVVMRKKEIKKYLRVDIDEKYLFQGANILLTN
ncbi:MAG: hypothetical protein MJ069_04355 [Salinivirgaceae bacterium]|nr:hypothetical protein [Salinivirgaceae bacterium]